MDIDIQFPSGAVVTRVVENGHSIEWYPAGHDHSSNVQTCGVCFATVTGTDGLDPWGNHENHTRWHERKGDLR